MQCCLNAMTRHNHGPCKCVDILKGETSFPLVLISENAQSGYEYDTHYFLLPLECKECISNRPTHRPLHLPVTCMWRIVIKGAKLGSYLFFAVFIRHAYYSLFFFEIEEFIVQESRLDFAQTAFLWRVVFAKFNSSLPTDKQKNYTERFNYILGA